MAWTAVRRCGLVALLCGIWNLLGDLVYIDFYLAHMTFEGFGTIDTVSRPGNLFDFDRQGWPLRLAQAGGWVYPVWAVATAYPLYVGLRGEGAGSGSGWWHSAAPCALLAYGLCVVGGALHSGFRFSTVLPQVLHTQPQLLEGAEGGPPMAGCSPASCAGCLRVAQAEVMDAYAFGYMPGPPAVMAASVWIAHSVATRPETRFPRWFGLCTPPVTMAWVAAAGLLVVPDPWDKYFVGAFGTWILLVMNVATSCILWNVDDRETRSKFE